MFPGVDEAGLEQIAVVLCCGGAGTGADSQQRSLNLKVPCLDYSELPGSSLRGALLGERLGEGVCGD